MDKKKIYLFSVNTKNISSHVLKISAISLVLRTHEITDIFNTFDEINLAFTEKKLISSIYSPGKEIYDHKPNVHIVYYQRRDGKAMHSWYVDK